MIRLTHQWVHSPHTVDTIYKKQHIKKINVIFLAYVYKCLIMTLKCFSICSQANYDPCAKCIKFGHSDMVGKTWKNFRLGQGWPIG